jgi:hypothetical protein
MSIDGSIEEILGLIMDVEYLQLVYDDFLEFCHIKKREDETLPKFHVRFINTYDNIQLLFQQKKFMVHYSFDFQSEFCTLFWSQNQRNLGKDFFTAKRAQEFIAASQRV